MNLIETYANEVGRRLPEKNRADIEAEISSALQDMLEERSRAEGRPIDDEMTFAILKEYGDPEKVAASYLPERYLIGPALFPVFMTLAKIFLTITLIVVVVTLGVNLGQSAHDFQTGFQIVGTAVTNLYTSVLTSLGFLVFIFAIIEWVLYRTGEKVAVTELRVKQEWDPRSLTKITPPNRIKLGDIIAEIVFTFIAIILFNFYPQVFNVGYSSSGAWYIGTGTWTSVPIFSAAFFHFIPTLTVLWILTIVLDILLLRQGYWTLTTRIYSIGLKVVNIAIAIEMLVGPSLIALTAASLPPALSSIPFMQVFVSILPQFVKVALWLSILGNAIEIIRALVNLFSNRPIAIAIQGKS